jgi:hypothetical protein
VASHVREIDVEGLAHATRRNAIDALPKLAALISGR